MARASKGKLRYLRELYRNYVDPKVTLMTETNIKLYQQMFPGLRLKIGDRFRIRTARWPKAALDAMSRHKSTSWRFT